MVEASIKQRRRLVFGVFKRVIPILLVGAVVSACTSTVASPRGDARYSSLADKNRASNADTVVSRERLIDTADRLFEAGKIAAAIPLYRSAMVTYPERARLGLARALVAEGRPEGALDLTNTCYPACGKDLMVIRGEAQLALGRYEQARDTFREAMVSSPSAKGLAGLGIALALTGDYNGAIDAFEKLPPPTGPSNKALVLIAMGRADEGREILEQMVRDGTAGVKERQNLALAYVLLGDTARARTFAQLDLDLQSALQTLAFYRQLSALNADARLQALVTGSIDPRWTRRDAANFIAKSQETAAAASERLLASAEAVILAPEPEPTPVEPEPTPDPAPTPDLVPTPVAESGRPEPLPADAPPLLEPEGWAVQIAAYRRIKALMRGWDILRENNMDILKSIPPRRSEVDFGAEGRIEGGPTGFYYRLNAGPLDTLAEAQALCKTLILRGTACWVRPPEVTEGRLPSTN